jgi:hypothetical protein
MDLDKYIYIHIKSFVPRKIKMNSNLSGWWSLTFFFFVLSSLEHFSIIYSVAFSVRSVLTEKNRGFGPRQMHAIDIIHTTLDVSELSMSKTCFVQSCHACRAEWKKGDDIFHTTSVHYGAKFSNWFSKCIFLRLTHKDCSFNFQNLYHKKCLHLVLNVLLIKLTSSIKKCIEKPMKPIKCLFDVSFQVSMHAVDWKVTFTTGRVAT